MTDNETLALQQLILDNSSLFWWVPEDKKKNLSLVSLVEAILNYGNSNSVKQLFEICGIQKVSEIFFSHINGQRTNYLPQTIHYFSLYFKKYA